jgi:hypothetical protein
MNKIKAPSFIVIDDKQKYLDEFMDRVRRRPDRPTSTLNVPVKFDLEDVIPVNFVSMDSSSIPQGTIQICTVLSHFLCKHMIKTNMSKDVSTGIFIHRDGRLVAIAQSHGEKHDFRIVEECWTTEGLN